MFDNDVQFNETHTGPARTIDAEFSEVKRFQWVVPFLCGLFAALLVAAAIFAAFTLKMGPFAVSDRQTSLENAITGAADDIGQQVDDAAALQEAATLDPALSSQAVNVAGMLFGPNSIQAIAQLTSAETNGLVKCTPSLTALAPEKRAEVAQVSCTLTPPTQAGGQPSASPLAGAIIAIGAADGRVTSLTFTPAGAQTPTATGDSMPSAPVEAAPAAPAAAAPAENAPKFETPPSSPAPDEAPAPIQTAPPAAGDAPPVQ